jgi:hypothetical protein
MTIPGPGLFAAEQAEAAVPSDPELERTRQEVKMLDDLFKNAIVLIDHTYVKSRMMLLPPRRARRCSPQ